ncbi:MAG TPA: hypothetical protein DCG57_07470 [Candidatus Riflebacteria bacterium]|nr:hypothetical protein [Candidatus Riflebacteria bacterium]
MGLDTNGIKFLLYARSIGVRFNKIAMIGRQNLDLSANELKTIINEYGLTIDLQQARNLLSQSKGYAEPLLQWLGAEHAHSFDYSAYENATYLCDMNSEIADNFKNQYSIVLDGGSLEHVFNLPVAFKNCMEMLQTGGYYLGISPANNFFGHGFYQFSPELFFSIFTSKNGFEIIDLIAFEDMPGATWYSVQNPSQIGKRVTLANRIPVYLLVIARKMRETEIFKNMPQQSDYQTVWKSVESPQRLLSKNLSMHALSIATEIRRYIPSKLKQKLTRMLKGHVFGFSEKFFKVTRPTKRP